ncbi:hypothetical protein QE197_00610 [Arsenophonus nasoniae]|uniref:Two-component response regulator n=1 Tax=Arsenophonus nasoniae TaxID=638 RepID=D2TZS6_9GAMM|nr:hypothetical protein [Arsenophonus nasoniae]QBY41744.1 hypothetical protein ArsFIN_02720 [Arsenophonus nasoniae]WGM05929.1 hypothetical protein QE258_00620 [Arsenophonus nasoniae]WGM10939.1 hypothetical protein QE197_00610 [Arsenophonus nasoniae]WGM15643.1 hypothetical protein QE193_00595 [Arsenophonus nasoniae]CBA73303.1 two-component response regulator [Arsenophonus nasoniae]
MSFILSTPNNPLSINDSRLNAVKATKEKSLKYKGKINVYKKCNKYIHNINVITIDTNNAFKGFSQLEQSVFKKNKLKLSEQTETFIINDTLTSQINVSNNNPVAETAKLKAEITLQYANFQHLTNLAALSEELANMYHQIHLQKVVEIKKVENIKLEAIIEKQNINELKSYLKKLHSYNRKLQGIIIHNLELLPTPLERTLPLLTNKNATAIIKDALIEASRPPKNIFTRLTKFIFPEWYEQQQKEILSYEVKLGKLHNLVLRLQKIKGFEDVAAAAWLHAMVRQLFLQATPKPYPFDPLKLLSPEHRLWCQKLKIWGIIS